MIDYLVVEGEKTVLLAQCSWCGRMLNGPLIGQCMLMLSSEGEMIPDLSQAETHSICASCCREWVRASRRCLRH